MKNKHLKFGILCFALSALLGILLACAPSPDNRLASIQVTDQLGRIVKLDKIPQRIISLAPSNTEIVFALGLADRLVAVTDYCDYPPAAKQKPSIGGFSTPNIEQVVAYAPDLVLAASIHAKTIIPKLEQRGLTVLALSPNTIDEVLAAISLVGKVTGNKKEAAALVAQMQKRVKTVTDKTDGLSQTRRPGVLYVVWHDPLMAAGAKTLLDELIRQAGGVNIARDLNEYAEISLEVILQTNPQVIIAGTGHGAGRDSPYQFVKTEPRLAGTDARRNERIYQADSNVVTRGGPRIVEGLEIFARMIHPEIFGRPQ